jgi:Na+/H+-dicarboxylate symporter
MLTSSPKMPIGITAAKIATKIPVLLGLDAILDMARTGINVLGNCLASAVVARWEGYKL